jgi:ankyrin repeat protein
MDHYESGTRIGARAPWKKSSLLVFSQLDCPLAKAYWKCATPLMLAASVGSEEIAGALIAAGAAINHVPPACSKMLKNIRYHMTAGARFGRITDLRDFACGGGHSSPLNIAAAHGHVGVLKRLIEAEASVERTSIHYWQALVEAACSGQAGAVQCLVSSMPEIVNMANSTGLTALMAGAINDHAEVLDVLIKADAGLHLAEASGMTAFEITACCGSIGCARALLKLGANVDQADMGLKTHRFKGNFID